MAKKEKLPRNPLAELHPVDTIANVQRVTCFVEDWASRTDDDSGLPNEVRHGLWLVMRTVNDALKHVKEDLEKTD